jgi:hypothetical protein
MKKNRKTFLGRTFLSWPFNLPVKDDGSLALVILKEGVKVDGQDHFDNPIIVGRWNNKLKTTGGSHRLAYEDVLKFIEIEK